MTVQSMKYGCSIPIAGCRTPKFTADGKALVYSIRENGMDNLWIQPRDGSRGRQITNFLSDSIYVFRFSPDDKPRRSPRS